MASQFSTVDFEYPLIGPFMDAGGSLVNLKDGFFSKLVGVDGRYQRCIRKFLGFQFAFWGLTGGFLDRNTLTPNLKFFNILRDKLSGGTEVRRCSLYGKATIRSQAIEDAGASASGAGTLTLTDWNADTDVAANGRFTYCFSEGETPRVWSDPPAAVVTTEDLGPTAFAATMTAPTAGAPSDEDGYLSFRGTYDIAYRWVHPVRGVASDLSPRLSYTFAEDAGSECYLPVTCDRPEALSSSWTTLRVYRTINQRGPLDVYQGGVLFLEQEIEDATDGQSVNIGEVDVGLTDIALVQQDMFDPWADPVIAPPKGSACAFYEGSLFAAKISGEQGFYWSNPYKEAPEEFGANYKFDGSGGDGDTLRFLEVASHLIAVCEAAIYRITKNGGQISVVKLTDSYVPVRKECITRVGNTLLLLTVQGIVGLDVNTGAIELYSHADRILHEQWSLPFTLPAEEDDESVDVSTSFDWLTMAHDDALGCTFILHPEKFETLCIWSTTKGVTLLEGTPYHIVAEGLDMGSKDADELWLNTRRAFFLDRDGAVLKPSLTGSPVSAVDRSKGGTAAAFTLYEEGEGTQAASLTCDDLSEYDVGKAVYVTSGTTQGLLGIITSVNSVGESVMIENSEDGPEDTTMYYPVDLLLGEPADYVGALTFSEDYQYIPSGTHYQIAPTPFKAYFKPLMVGENPRFSRKVLHSGQFHFSLLNGFSTEGVNDVFRVGVYRNYSQTPAVSSTLVPSLNPAANSVRLNVDGVVLQPFLENVSFGTQFEIPAVLFKIAANQSKSVET